VSPTKPRTGKAAADTSKPSSALFEQTVQRFEKSWTSTSSFEQLLESESAAEYPEIFRELACIDLEFRWTAGQAPQLDSYLQLGRARGLSELQLHELAFEDYRLRKRLGQPKLREWYAEQFQLDVSGWPVWDTQSGALESESRKRESDGETAKLGLSPALPQVGSSFHGCTLVGVLGRGAFGCVYLARQAGLANRFVVLKVTPISDHEPQLLAELQHTHIVPIYSFERDEQWQSICMPFLGLVTLADLRPDSRQLSLSGQELLSTIAARKADTIAASTRAAGPVSTEVAELLQPERHSRLAAIQNLDCQRSLLWMFARIAEALGFAHSQGVVHGDLKPANILVSDEGNPLLLDFHLAARTQGENRPEHVGGTLPYMSPQQLGALEKGEPPAASSDLFSLGVVMFELLGGRLPFSTRGQDRESIAAMISERHQPPPKLRQFNSALSVDVETIIEKCLAAERAGGYRSMRELQEDLDSHLANRPLRHAPNRSLRERIVKWTRRHPVLASTWSLAGLFLLMAVLVGSLVAGRLQSARRLEANAASEQFVRELKASVVPLTIPGLDPKSSDSAAENLVQQIGRRYQTAENSETGLLSESQKSAESAQLAVASFWLTQSALAGFEVAPSDSRRAEQLKRLVSQVEQLAAQVPGEISAAFVDLRGSLQRATGQNGQLDLAEIELLKPKAESGSESESTPESLILKAAQAVGRGEPEGALEQLDRALAQDSDNYQAWLLKGHAWLLAGNRERASEAYSFCVALQPDSPWGWFQRGLVRLEQGDLRGSRSDFSRCIELEAKEPTAWLNRALAARATGDLNSALADLSEAIDLGCSETRALFLRSQVYRQLGRAEEADRDLKTFLELEPSDLKSWLARGLVRARANEPDLALADFQAALRLVPDSVEAWQNIATVQSEMLKQLSNAIESLNEIAKLRPNDPIPIVTRGVLLGRMEDRPGAHADAERAMRLRSDADVLFRAAGVYALTSRVNEQDAEQALHLLRRAAFEDPRLVLSRIEGDTDLLPIHNHPEYQRVLASLKLLAEQTQPPTEVKQ
jgi:serine/threonine protein kinase/regulator of sirC expression with transglutaminase-like and TPR domain